ncbi:Variable outer membrane protein (plasmid) [Borrelia crocidurae DOU]|uniref:Variable large protein n=1 Tax=Borrelia crocidurae DOU TaxID=1293575 RepID=W5SM74_9SPIR|nr:variable large family protein [Borrelia crocidurae]AHH07768.1 Variable outer membrane protein [Borrelia crocidurae DOU]
MKEKKGLGEIGRREERREGRVKGRIVLGIMMMMVVMVMGCNSGGVGEGEEGKNKFLQSLVNVSNEFLNVFTSFGEMVGSVLGLNVESKKSDVGKYFKTVQETVQGTKDKLEKIVAEMKEEKNPNVVGVEMEVKKLVTETFDKIIEGAKTASEAIGVAGDELLGNVAAANSAGVSGADVEKLIRGIKGIVDIVLKGVGNAEAGNGKKASDGSTARTANGGNDEAGKLFDSTANNGVGAAAGDAKKAAADASKAVGAVTGADILKAIIKNGNAAAAQAKDATIAGAIALRAMTKGGKFPGASNTSADNADYTVVVKDVVLSALTKALDVLTIAIRSTVDEGLKTVKKTMKINVNVTPVASEKSSSGDQNQ